VQLGEELIWFIDREVQALEESKGTKKDNCVVQMRTYIQNYRLLRKYGENESFGFNLSMASS
jgi:hypothetical protein